jgi:hypothetical protein
MNPFRKHWNGRAWNSTALRNMHVVEPQPQRRLSLQQPWTYLRRPPGLFPLKAPSIPERQVYQKGFFSMARLAWGSALVCSVKGNVRFLRPGAKDACSDFTPGFRRKAGDRGQRTSCASFGLSPSRNPGSSSKSSLTNKAPSQPIGISFKTCPGGVGTRLRCVAFLVARPAASGGNRRHPESFTTPAPVRCRVPLIYRAIP